MVKVHEQRLFLLWEPNAKGYQKLISTRPISERLKVLIFFVMSQSEALIAGPIKGYKAFEPDFTCRGYAFKVGQTYELPDGETPELCKRGFHFCEIPLNCNNYYYKDSARYAEIVAWDVLHDEDKSVARKITITREIPREEWDYLEGKFEGHMSTGYIKKGKWHREDGPAYEGAYGTKIWYKNGQCHRAGGPAIERADGSKEWYENDRLHRLDGPAIERADGSKEWYIDGQRTLSAWILD